MTPPRRLQSQTQRDEEGFAARKERDAAPIAPADDADSMAHDIEERPAIRAKRDTKDRVVKLEAFKDTIDSKVDGIDSRLSRMEGKLDTALSVIVPVKQTESREKGATERHRIDSRTKIIIAIVGLVGTVLGLVLGAGCS